MYSSIDEKFAYFDNRLCNLFKNTFPLRTKIVNEKPVNKPMITTAILNFIRTKSDYSKMFKRGIIDRGKIYGYQKNCY